MIGNDENMIESVGGVNVRSERIEFDAAELVACEGCGRANAPTRAGCIYCGRALPGAAGAELKLRELEPWEKGFSVVLVDAGGASTIPTPLPIDMDVFRRALDMEPPVPLVRVASESAAMSVADKFREAGARCIVVGDDVLEDEGPPVRLRSLSMIGGRFVLTDFNTVKRHEFAADALEAIVAGRIFEERSEQTLRKDRKGVTETDAGSTVSDSGVVDLYFPNDERGFRIEEAGFDFSWLGAGKSIIAAENMKKLVERLREASPSARYVDDYGGKRNFIANVWPAEPRNDSTNVRRLGFRRSIENVLQVSNREQFTKYSRLLRRIL